MHRITRSLSTATVLGLFVCASSINASSNADRIEQIKTRACVEWLVDGVPYIRTAGAISSGSSVPVTDQTDYPLPYALTNLGLAPWTPAAWREVAKVLSSPRLVFHNGISAGGATEEAALALPPQNTAFLSLGEGRGALVPFALSQGLRAVGADPVNDELTGRHDKYYGKFYLNSMAADARDLHQLADQSRELVVSHMLLPHLNREDRVAVLRESFRLLVPKGTARHSILVPDIESVLGNDAELLAKYESVLVDSLKKLVTDALGDSGYQVAVFVDYPRIRLSNIPGVAMDSLVDTDVTAVSYDEMKEKAAPLERKALNVLVVLRRPDNSWWSSESWFGK